MNVSGNVQHSCTIFHNIFCFASFQDEIENKGAVVFDYTDLISDPGNLLSIDGFHRDVIKF